VSDGWSLAGLVELQRHGCALTSPLYGTVLAAVAEDLDRGGPCHQILAPHAGEPLGSALVLRLLGAVHRLVLAGRAPELAAHYPSAGGTPGSPEAVREAFTTTVARLAGEVAAGTDEAVQTNEVGRSAALVGGYLTVARLGLPLRVLEIGSSAGLNLRWDRFRYQADDWSFGDPDSPVRFTDAWRGTTPPLATGCEVADRLGCDPNPIDPTTPAGAALLRSFVWPDQLDRLARLDAAIEVARRVPAEVHRADGPGWLAEQLVEPEPGLTTVIVHSIVMQYLDHAARSRFSATVEQAGARATAAAPLAWLRLEPRDDRAELRLTLWPGGHELLLATSGFHGPPVKWQG